MYIFKIARDLERVLQPKIENGTENIASSMQCIRWSRICSDDLRARIGYCCDRRICRVCEGCDGIITINIIITIGSDNYFNRPLSSSGPPLSKVLATIDDRVLSLKELFRNGDPIAERLHAATKICATIRGFLVRERLKKYRTGMLY